MNLALGVGSFTNMINEQISRVHHDGIAILLILKVNTRGPFMFKDRLLYILYMDSLKSYHLRNLWTLCTIVWSHAFVEVIIILLYLNQQKGENILRESI